jgi:hypothetical protein
MRPDNRPQTSNLGNTSCAQRLKQAVNIDGFDKMVIETCRLGSDAIFNLAVSRYRN